MNNVSYRYVYDIADRLAKVVDSQGNSTVYGYDANNNKNKFTEKINGKTYDISYGYDKDNRPYDVQYSNNHIMYDYDSLGRKKKDSYLTPTQFGSNGYYVEYSYADGVGGSTTTKVSSINFLHKGRTINYTYDSKGNIDTINDNNKKIQYYYNELNEVIREDNQVLNKTIVYSYDSGGNILTKTEYNYTTDTNPANPVNTYNYVYGDSNWKDKLTSYNGKAITYDAIGNPLTYDGWTFTWEEGRQLSSMSKTGTNISYKYNDNGVRTEKNVNGVVTKYHLNGDDVTYEDNGTDKIYYTYDSSGKLISMNLNGTEYYYARNGQGDIIGLFDTNGNDVVSYTYDTWGKLISIDGSLKDTVGVKNPYRYRGYRYDTDTGLYYLQRRYYNSEWDRFINADGYIGSLGELLSNNLFSYCGNNPIIREDQDGESYTLVSQILGGVAMVLSPVGIATVATLGTIGYLGYMGYDWYKRNHVTYSQSNSNTTNNNQNTQQKNPSNNTKPSSNGKAKNKLKPDPNAKGDHSTFKRDPNTGEITNYETYKPNPFNPKGFDLKIRYDGVGDPHFNKVTKERLIPHVHDKTVPGEVREPIPWEIPIKR